MGGGGGYIHPLTPADVFVMTSMPRADTHTVKNGLNRDVNLNEITNITVDHSNKLPVKVYTV